MEAGMRRLIGSVVVLWMLHGSAAMAAPGVLDAPLSLQAGSAATLRVEVPATATVCSFTAKSGKHRIVPSRYKVSNRLVSFSWRIPRNASAAKWSLRATCSSTEVKLRSTRGYTTPLRVRILKGVRKRRAVLVAGGKLRVRSSGLPDANAGLVGPSGDVGGKGAGSGCDGYGADAGGYCLGFCTHYAWTKRTDLTRLGHARDWWAGAEARGIPRGSTPTPGAIAWWGSSFGGGYGHVAYVESVNGNSVAISEMNAPGWNRISSRSIPLGSPGAPQGYIYGGAAGGGPSGQAGGGPTGQVPGQGPGGQPGGITGAIALGIGVLDSAGDFHVKVGDLGATWVREAGPGAQQIALSGNRIGVLDSVGDFYVKEGDLGAPWIREAGPGAKQIALSGNRIGVLDSVGDFHVKEGSLYATWIREAGPGALKIALSGNRIGVLDSAGDFHVKEGDLGATWIREAGPGAKQIALSGNRIGVLDSVGDFHVKEGSLYAPWIREAGPGAKEIALPGG